MALRRGFFRLWIAASLLWAGFAGWSVYQATAGARAADQSACVELRKAQPQLGNPFDCFDAGMEFGDLLPPGTRIREFAVLTLPPVIGAFVLGVAVMWIAAGFRERGS